MQTTFCERGHLVSVLSREVESCPFCGSNSLKETNWINDPEVSIDPVYWEVYWITLDDGTEFEDDVPVYDVSSIFNKRV